MLLRADVLLYFLFWDAPYRRHPVFLFGGPVSYKGMPADYPWIGSGRKEATAGDLDRAIRLMWLTTAIGTLLFSLILALPHLQPS